MDRLLACQPVAMFQMALRPMLRQTQSDRQINWENGLRRSESPVRFPIGRSRQSVFFTILKIRFVCFAPLPDLFAVKKCSQVSALFRRFANDVPTVRRSRIVYPADLRRQKSTLASRIARRTESEKTIFGTIIGVDGGVNHSDAGPARYPIGNSARESLWLSR